MEKQKRSGREVEAPRATPRHLRYTPTLKTLKTLKTLSHKLSLSSSTSKHLTQVDCLPFIFKGCLRQALVCLYTSPAVLSCSVLLFSSIPLAFFLPAAVLLYQLYLHPLGGEVAASRVHPVRVVNGDELGCGQVSSLPSLPVPIGCPCDPKWIRLPSYQGRLRQAFTLGC